MPQKNLWQQEFLIFDFELFIGAPFQTKRKLTVSQAASPFEYSERFVFF